MLRWMAIGLAVTGWLGGCKSDSKLQDDLDPGLVPGLTTDPGGTGPQTGPGTDTDTDTDTDTPDTDTPSDPPTGDTGDPVGTGTPSGPPDTGLTDDEICSAAATLASYLDPYQSTGDGRVLFCHAGGGSNYILIETDISSCLPHLNHPNDVFPTTGCDS